MTEDEMVGWHHRLNGHESEHTPGDGEGQGSLACCSPRGRKALDTTESLKNNSNPHGAIHDAGLMMMLRNERKRVKICIEEGVTWIP